VPCLNGFLEDHLDPLSDEVGILEPLSRMAAAPPFRTRDTSFQDFE